MNSIFLLLLLLGFCNHSDSECGCEKVRPCGGSNRRDRRTCDSSEREDRRTCGAPEREECEERRTCGTPGQNARREENPFSPFNREQRDDQDYPPFRGNKGPCGCEDTQDA